MNLVEQFLTRAEARPDAAALITGRGEQVTYRQLAERSAARAIAMRRAGIGRGDVVLLARGVSPALYETVLGVFRLGAVVTFPEPAAGLAGVDVAISSARPKAIATSALIGALRPFMRSLRRLPAVGGRRASLPGDGPLESMPGDAPALITFTSGSTGRPKGIVRSVDFLMLQHRLLEQIRRTTPQDVDLISLPVFILSNLVSGATSVLPRGRLTRPASLDGRRLRRQIREHGVNRVVAPPAVCERLVDADDGSLDRLSAVFTGGGPVFPNLLRRLGEAAPSARVHAVYGSTEAEPIAHVRLDEIAEEDFALMASGRGLLAGMPIAEVDVDIVDDELWVAGAHVNPGYLDAADDASTKVRRGGRIWHRTGDAARRDAQGRLWLLGRRSAAAGALYPFACEAAALTWPGVRQAALLADGPRPRLAIAGDHLQLEDLERRARALGDITLVRVAAIPTDARHNSKVDYPRLRRLLA